jgi:hypothetical protein
MEKEFIPYELALRMKQLGFDEDCCKYVYVGDTGINVDHYLEVEPSKAKNYNKDGLCISQPLFQQAFRWFRENYNLLCEINIDKTMEPKFAYTIMEYESAQFFEGFNEDILSEYLYYKHEEAELVCLEKLIEIVEGIESQK